MIQYNRRNTIWLAIITIMMALAFIGGSILPTAQVALLAMLAVAVTLSFIQPNRNPIEVFSALQNRTASSSRNSRITAQAREAQSRAQSRGMVLNPDLGLIDVGLIASSHGEDGMVMRRTRSISKDDDGVRPFVTLDVHPLEADRKAVLRFEIIDQNGNEQYIHEMDVYLRDGELNVVADHHLPLANNPEVEGMGDWDMRIYLDGRLYGMHSFQLTPSVSERRNRLGGKQERPRRYHIPKEEQESGSRKSSMTLEELLRDQDSQDRQSSSRK